MPAVMIYLNEKDLETYRTLSDTGRTYTYFFREGLKIESVIRENRIAREAVQHKMEALLEFYASGRAKYFHYDGATTKYKHRVIILDVQETNNNKVRIIYRHLGEKDQYETLKTKEKIDERIRKHFSI